MKRAMAIFALITGAAGAQEKPAQFWNLTTATVTSLRLSHAGSGEYGDNVAAGDADGVDHDERVKVADLPTGKYDLQMKFKGGRTCTVRDLAITAGKVFAVEDSNLVACTNK